MVLVYQPPRSPEKLELVLDPLKLKKVQGLAALGEPAGVRDLLLGEEPRADLLSSPALSSVISANTWRWALPLFGGPPPPRRRSSGSKPQRARHR